MTFGGSAGICCRNQKLIATIPPETRPGQSLRFSSSRSAGSSSSHSAGSSSSFFMIFITSGLITRRLLVVLPKTLILSLYAASLRKNKELRERKEKQLLLISLNSVKYCFPKFFNSSELRPRIMIGQVKDKLRNELISAS